MAINRTLFRLNFIYLSARYVSFKRLSFLLFYVRRRGLHLARLFLTCPISTKYFVVIYQVDCGSVLQPVAMKKIEEATHTLNHWR